MALTSSSDCRNHLLTTMSADDFRLIQAGLEPVELEVRKFLEQRDRPVTHVYFPESSFASVVAKAPRGQEIEVGIIGNDGVTGLNLIMGNDRSPHDVYVQNHGEGHRLEAQQMKDALNQSPTLRIFLLRFAQAFMLQTASTAMANGLGKVEQRLARWLLMAHDRTEGDELSLTHEFLSLMLGVRRAGVTTALHMLEEQRLISKARKHIVVADRAGLMAFATGLYGRPEAESLRLTGWRSKG
jgi:CRP-like cAMP-binding protein